MMSKIPIQMLIWKILNYENVNLEIGIRNYGHRDVMSIQNDENIYDIIYNQIKNFDIIIFLGAGNITNYANLLTKKLNLIKRDKN